MAFERIGPGRRPARRRDGRAALFSVPDARPPDQAGSGETAGAPGSGSGLRLICSRCGAANPVTPAAAVRAVFPLALVVPGREQPIFAVCAQGRHRAWMRLAW